MRIRYLILPLVLAVIPLAASPPARAQVSIGVTVNVAPPPLPVYAQPAIPGPGYVWMPGYWAWGPDGYYWVPGTWVMPPEVGLLWTPGYWGWSNGIYIWHAGYWGPHVGWYGGVDYGFGYPGVGFYGGHWVGHRFFYNREAWNVGGRVHDVYRRPYFHRRVVNRTSYNGGRGGIHARPTAAERAFEHEHHLRATAEQVRHREMARHDRRFWASVNHGRPGIAATRRPGAYHGRGVVATRPGGGMMHGHAAFHRGMSPAAGPARMHPGAHRGFARRGPPGPERHVGTAARHVGAAPAVHAGPRRHAGAMHRAGPAARPHFGAARMARPPMRHAVGHAHFARRPAPHPRSAAHGRGHGGRGHHRP
jgi:WXXGXW repeat (2 copies)